MDDHWGRTVYGVYWRFVQASATGVFVGSYERHGNPRRGRSYETSASAAGCAGPS